MFSLSMTANANDKFAGELMHFMVSDEGVKLVRGDGSWDTVWYLKA